MSAWNKTLYSFIAMTNLKMLWNQFLNFCFTQYIALFIAIFHQVLQYDFSGNIHFYCKINLPLFLTVWSCLVCWTVSSWVTRQRRGWGSYSQCMRMSWIRPCMPTSACSINRDSSLKILAASQRDFKMHQQVSLYCNWQCYIQFYGFGDFTKKD